MERVDLDAVETATTNGVQGRRLGDVLGTEHVAVNHYAVEAGGRTAGIHADQAEVFVVLNGEAIFETLDGRVPVASGGAVRFEAGEFQSCTAPTAASLEVLALGAPMDTDDVRIPVRCSHCGHDEHRLAFPDGDDRLVCPDCGAATSPACPDCGGDSLRVVLDDAERPVDRYLECGATTPAR